MWFSVVVYLRTRNASDRGDGFVNDRKGLACRESDANILPIRKRNRSIVRTTFSVCASLKWMNSRTFTSCSSQCWSTCPERWSALLRTAIHSPHWHLESRSRLNDNWEEAVSSLPIQKGTKGSMRTSSLARGDKELHNKGNEPSLFCDG